MYAQKSSSVKIELQRNTTTKPQAELYKQQQAQIESQQLNHMMAANMAPSQQSATHFFASLLQNPAVLANPELMASVASMLQQSLANPAMGMAPMATHVQPQFPSGGNCFRNFSIPNSESSSQLKSIIESSICGGSDHTGSQRSNSISSSDKEEASRVGVPQRTASGKFSHASSDQDSNACEHQIDIKGFKDSSDLVVNKVMTVIEEILADRNLLKNNFLMKLFEESSSDAQGRPEILIKRIAGFKRVKAITSEFKMVQAAIRASSMFEISADDLAAFRKNPLPEVGTDCSSTLSSDFQDAAPSLMSSRLGSIKSNSSSCASGKDISKDKVVKKILAINFKEEEFTIETMTQTFEKIGEIAQIILIRPNRKVPDFLSEYTQWVPDLGVRPCAIIDFESQDSAQNACREINMSNKEGSSVRCALLKPGARIKRTLYRKYNSSSSCGSSSEASGSRNTSAVSSNSSLDSGLTENDRSVFNRKDVKKAISKHFISLGAYKNAASAGKPELQALATFVRQPKGPVSDQGSGFSGEYQRSRVLA